MEINVQIKNKTDKIPHNFLMNLVRPIISEIDFLRIFYFRMLRKFVLFSRIFVNISNLTVPTKHIEQNRKSIQLPIKWIFIEYRAFDSSGDIIFLKTLWFADIIRMRHFLR